jgi:hypothetical protein
VTGTTELAEEPEIRARSEFGPQMFVSFDRVPRDRAGALLARSDRTSRDRPAAGVWGLGFDKGTLAGTLTGQCGQARNLPGGGEPTGPRPLSNPSPAAARAAGTGCGQNSRTRDLSDSGCDRCSRTSAVASGEQNHRTHARINPGAGRRSAMWCSSPRTALMHLVRAPQPPMTDALCHGRAAPPSQPARRAVATPAASRVTRLPVPLVRRRRTRSGIGKPVTELRRSLLSRQADCRSPGERPSSRAQGCS